MKLRNIMEGYPNKYNPSGKPIEELITEFMAIKKRYKSIYKEQMEGLDGIEELVKTGLITKNTMTRMLSNVADMNKQLDNMKVILDNINKEIERKAKGRVGAN